MKEKLLSIIVSLGLVACLFIGAMWSLQEKEIKNNDTSQLSYEQLFVDIKSDTLTKYLNQYFKTENHPSLSIEDKSRKLIIEYNRNAPILLNIIDNGMNEERRELEKSGVIFDDAFKTKIVLDKHSLNGVEYVRCPSPILSEILRIKTQQQ